VDVPLIQPWAPAPLTARAREGVVDVWRADLTAIGDQPEQLLCKEELARAAQIVHQRDRVLWARSRGVLRALLARYLGSDPRELSFELGPHGKPALLSKGPTRPTRPGPGIDLSFNLSHSGEVALYAVSAKRAVGIDVELAHRRKIDELAIAERMLGHAQARRLASMEKGKRARELLRAWVVYEAAVKCRGTGLATPRGGSTADDLWTAELDVGPRAAAAVAVERGPCTLRCWEWRGD
jgi:4'-phosphopantetheinyl transferase